MDPKEAAKEDGKAFEAPRIEWLEGPSVHPDFLLQSSPSSQITRTGLLEIFRLVRLTSNRPEFIARWDHKKQVLDVDAISDDERIKNSFKAGRRGYAGHHPAVLSKDGGQYLIEIETPDGAVCKGVLSLIVFRKFRVADTL